MKNSFDEKILDEAKDWLTAKRNVVLATVIQTWGSSPRQVGSRMIVNDKGDFSGGSCLVREENFIVVNKRKPLEQRLKVLAREFGKINLADVYIVPALRLYIESSQSE